MRLFRHDTHNISAHYLPALINGDYSGLNDNDESLLTDYLNQFEGFYITHDVIDTETNIAKCTVSDLYSDCCKVSIYLQLIYREDAIYYLPDLFFHRIETTELPNNNSVTGYGSKIPTQYLLHCSDNYKRRVYARCYSNVSSLYIVVQGKEFYLHDYQL